MSSSYERREGEMNKRQNRVQLNLNIVFTVVLLYCCTVIRPFLTLHKPNKASPNTGQSSHDPTHCKACQPFAVFLPPQGTLGHSWQEAQIGFKAALSRLKNEPSNPEQMEFCVPFLSLPFPSPPVSNPSTLLLSPYAALL